MDPTKTQNRWSRLWSAVRKVLGVDPVWFWAINLAGVVTAVLWLLLDPRLEASVDWWRFEHAWVSSATTIRDMGDWWWLGLRNRTAVILLAIVCGSTLFMFLGLWFGPLKSRSLRAWILAVSFVGLWIAILTSWQEIAWVGKQRRLRRVIGEFEQVAVDLQNNWPAADAERPIIGPFMAYPVHGPRTLILLTLPEFENTKTSVSVIEGSRDAIRFELVGAERGDWLEWHPDGSSPDSFLGGLGEPYTIQRYQKLDRHWYLVRYKS